MQQIDQHSELVLTIDRIARELVGLTASALREGGEELTLVQYRVLALTEDYPGISLGALAEELRRDISTTSRVVKRLLKRGLIVANSDPTDRRRNMYELSDDGQELLRAVLATRRQSIAGRIDGAKLDLASLEELRCALVRK